MHELFNKDLDEVMRRAKQAKFAAILCSGVNRPTNEQALALAKKYPIIKPSLGLYPIDLIGLAPDAQGLSVQKNINLEKELDFIKQNIKQTAAIGEVGLDYHWSKEKKEHKQQKKNFQKIIDFTEKVKKPIIVHTRRAEQDCIEMLESSKIKHIVLHCFEGNKNLIKKALELNYFFSIPTTIIRSQHFQMLANLAPLTQLFTETDAPYLSPFPGQRNEPSFIKESIKIISKIKNLKEKEVENQIYNNFKKVFS